MSPKVGARSVARDPGIAIRESPYTGLATPYLDLPERTPAEQADWQKWWDTKDDTAYSGAGGYHPRPDIVEMRGGYPALTSAYGVGVPSNATLGRKFAAREQVGIQQKEADAKLATGQAHLKAAEEGTKQGEYNRSDAAYRRHLIDEGAGRGVPEAAAKAAEAGGFQSPAQSLVKQGLATTEAALPKTADEAIMRYADSGGGPLAPGSPQRAAFEAMYGDALNARVVGQPAHWWERQVAEGTNIGDMLQLGLPSFIRQLAGTKPYHERVAEQAQRLFPRAGVAGPAAPTRAGVAGPTYSQMLRQKRREAYDATVQGG